MKIVFDQGTPLPLRREFSGHQVETALEMEWQDLTNGDLLREAEKAFDLLITTDQNLRYQQDLRGRRLAILVLTTTSWPRIRKEVEQVVAAALAMKPGEFREFDFAE